MRDDSQRLVLQLRQGDLDAARTLFRAALRQGDAELLRRAVDVLIAAVDDDELREIGDALSSCGLAVQQVRDIAWRLVNRGYPLELEVTLPIGVSVHVSEEALLDVVDADAWTLTSPLGCELSWSPRMASELALDCARHVLRCYETTHEGDDRPATLISALSYRMGLGRETGRRESAPALDLRDIIRIAEDVWTTWSPIDDIGRGLKQIAERRLREALASFRNVRAAFALETAWDLFDDSGELLVNDPGRGLVGDALGALDDPVSLAAYGYGGHDPRHARSHERGSGADGRRTRRDLACEVAEMEGRREEAAWQRARLLDVLFGVESRGRRPTRRSAHGSTT